MSLLIHPPVSPLSQFTHSEQLERQRICSREDKAWEKIKKIEKHDWKSVAPIPPSISPSAAAAAACVTPPRQIKRLSPEAPNHPITPGATQFKSPAPHHFTQHYEEPSSRDVGNKACVTLVMGSAQKDPQRIREEGITPDERGNFHMPSLSGGPARIWATHKKPLPDGTSSRMLFPVKEEGDTASAVIALKGSDCEHLRRRYHQNADGDGVAKKLVFEDLLREASSGS